MSLWSRISNALRGERLNREIDEELQLHIEEAIASPVCSSGQDAIGYLRSAVSEKGANGGLAHIGRGDCRGCA
jgi:hypothetical protein